MVFLHSKHKVETEEAEWTETHFSLLVYINYTKVFNYDISWVYMHIMYFDQVYLSYYSFLFSLTIFKNNFNRLHHSIFIHEDIA
jgi:hypothetical protein